jgi:hypothetical protein
MGHNYELQLRCGRDGMKRHSCEFVQGTVCLNGYTILTSSSLNPYYVINNYTM